MPYMISDKALHVSENGADARFEANVERFVRPSLQAVAQRHGARVVDEKAPQKQPSLKDDEGPSDEQVHEAMRKLLESGEMKAFGADDLPKTRDLGKIVGAKVSAAQRNRVWEQVQ